MRDLVMFGLGAWIGSTLIFAGIFGLAALHDRLRKRQAGWDPTLDLEPWVVDPPYAARSCHPDHIDIDCVSCRRWLRARNNPPAGVT